MKITNILKLRAKSPKPLWLVLGLGNPGSQYIDTRHNVGYKVADVILKNKTESVKKLCESHYALCASDNDVFLLAKPLIFMNRSGGAAKCLLKKYELVTEKLIVIYDDIDLAIGKLRIRDKGSSGGHLGVESIILELGTQDFIRVKIGIGRPPENIDPVDYVLSEEKNKESRTVLDETIIDASTAVLAIINEGIESAMNKFNK